VDPADIEATILRLLAERGDGKTIGATDVARALPGAGTDWHLRMTPVRRVAIKLALQGRVVIYRKGKAVDPNDFKGVYRLGLARGG
jgi:hypothetical protein